MALTEKYVTWATASNLVGIDASTLNANIKDAIIERVEYLEIEQLLGQGMLFDQVYTIDTNIPELHSANDNQDFIVARNFPIVSVIRLRDNIHATVTSSILTLVEHTNFEIQKDTGIIKLVRSLSDSLLMKKIEFFTAGINTIDLCYTYGFDSVPNDIKAYADMLAAKIIKAWNQFYNLDGTESFQMGDYTEKVGEWFKHIDSQFDPHINRMLISLKSKYTNFMPLGTGSIRI